MVSMKKALLAVTQGCTGGVNIGDYIQALASKQFLCDTNIFIERETELADYDGEPVKMIMNGWFMNHPENWPPSDKIHPLFISFHINRISLPSILDKESIKYFKSYEPIGCRDVSTQKLLSEVGVKTYFSGCMTLTLGHKYKSTKRSNKVYIVEPCTHSIEVANWNVIVILKTLAFLFVHFCGVRCVTKKMGEGIKRLFHNAFYLMSYSKVFKYKMLVDADYINQYNEEILKNYPTNKDLLSYAESLVMKYAKAACVITSRIHCALPCLGLETPVIYLLDDDMGKYGKDRLDGLGEFFNIMHWDGKQLKQPFSLGKININNFPRNKDNWRPFANRLMESCVKFVNND